MLFRNFGSTNLVIADSMFDQFNKARVVVWNKGMGCIVI